MRSWNKRWRTIRRQGLFQVALAKVWNLVRGDNRVRSKLRVPEGGLVIDVGAFNGDFAATMRELWGARVIAIEPVPKYARNAAARFADDPAVTVYQAALGRFDGYTTVYECMDGSSAWIDGGDAHTVKLLDASRLVNDRQVSLMKINAEGAEFEILRRLVDSSQIRNVHLLLIQFHRFVPEASTYRRSLRKSLSATHECTLAVPWVWEVWKRRQS